MMDHNVTGNIQKTSKYISYVSFQNNLNGGKILTIIFIVVIVLYWMVFLVNKVVGNS